MEVGGGPRALSWKTRLRRAKPSLTFLGKGTCRASAQARVGKKHLGLEDVAGSSWGKGIYLLGGEGEVVF